MSEFDYKEYLVDRREDEVMGYSGYDEEPDYEEDYEEDNED
jgi:hypothetical protein